MKKIVCFGTILLSAMMMTTSVCAIGDTDASGFVDALDAANVLIRAAEIGAGSPALSEEFTLMDVNCDNEISAVDASVMLKYAAQAGSSKNQPDFTEYIALRTAPAEYDSAQYVSMMFGDIYTVFFDDDADYDPRSFLITSPADLDAFVKTMNGISDGFWTRRSTDGENEWDVPIEDTAAKYDEAWFREHDLIIVIALEPATKYYHNVRGITENEDGSWTVNIDRIVPMASEQTIPSFAIFVETNKAVEFASSVNVEMTNISVER